MNLTMSTSLSRALRIFLFWELQIWTHTPQQAVSFGKGFDFSKQSWLYRDFKICRIFQNVVTSFSLEMGRILRPPWRIIYQRLHMTYRCPQRSTFQPSESMLAPGYRAPQPTIYSWSHGFTPLTKWVCFLCGSQSCFSIQRKHQHRIVAFSDLSDCSPGLDFHNFFVEQTWAWYNFMEQHHSVWECLSSPLQHWA